MRLPKLEKVEAGIASAKAKIAEQQARLRELERLKTKVEDDRMVKTLRAEKISDAELGALVESFRRGRPDTQPAGPSAQGGAAKIEEERDYADKKR
jgi:HAMP domain-containing protein